MPAIETSRRSVSVRLKTGSPVIGKRPRSLRRLGTGSSSSGRLQEGFNSNKRTVPGRTTCSGFRFSAVVTVFDNPSNNVERSPFGCRPMTTFQRLDNSELFQ
jgi:hypothetical protein